ncbi:polysaccharide biosynthesis/export family protein [Coraliomargarita algicola]|uniref:Polysaccharide biosynthesis/export family protein n=1 Tax=Coraliomargarita algicola TaxID=3092156 RepID=A0ABZ0RMB7_9BACT|nr:polysaccharide biosynthesis/export family protein [Coraliomargarita sp. J2-16]WPJ97364.1 polysaccharide biosynthesis/export family protein [Coraliomargarita sp. J2-16]
MTRIFFSLTILLVVNITALTAVGQSTASAPHEPENTTSSIYKLAPFDMLMISVYGQPDLSSEQRVTDQGSISVPLLGEVSVGGLTVSQAQKQIEEAFIEQRYLVKPVITISIEAFSPKVITVLGEVTNPGSIEIPHGRNGLPIQIAIAQAGGFTGAAAKTNVKITRANTDATTTEPKNDTVNISAILESEGDEKLRSPYFVMPDDIIFVPRRLF